jgi:hypothetical protein
VAVVNDGADVAMLVAVAAAGSFAASAGASFTLALYSMVVAVTGVFFGYRFVLRARSVPPLVRDDRDHRR